MTKTVISSSKDQAAKPPKRNNEEGAAAKRKSRQASTRTFGVLQNNARTSFAGETESKSSKRMSKMEDGTKFVCAKHGKQKVATITVPAKMVPFQTKSLHDITFFINSEFITVITLHSGAFLTIGKVRTKEEPVYVGVGWVSVAF